MRAKTLVHLLLLDVIVAEVSTDSYYVYLLVYC
jgi:hypothetical protein